MQYAIAGWPVAGCPSESLLERITRFPVFLISPAFRGRYFHSHFQEFSHERLLHSGSS